MKYMVNKNKILLNILCVFLLGGCISLDNGASQRISSNENFHVFESVSYPDSPFGDFVDRAFKENTHFVHILEIGDIALLERIHLIRAAKKSIYIQTYIWSDDEAGRLMIYELVKAAQRGVKVRVIIDQVANNLGPGLVAYFATASPNIKIKFYNPSVKKVDPHKLNLLMGLFNIKKINQRMHNKIVVIDDKIGITGGRNYQNDYYDRGTDRNFKDRDVLVIGPIVREMTDSFQEYWEFYMSIDSHDMVDVKKIIKRNKVKPHDTKDSFNIGNTFDEMDQCASSAACVKNAIGERIHKVDKIRFIVDQPGKNKKIGLGGGGRTTEELAKLMQEAKKELIIQTPYLVLNRPMKRFFRKIIQERPDLNILVSSNSLSAADHYYAYAFSYKHKKYYLKELKWRIFEFKYKPRDINAMVPPIEGVERTKDYFTCIHSKSTVVDDEISYIGSFNIDPRSVNLNTEVGFIIYDKNVADELKKYIFWDMAPQNSWTIGRKKDLPLKSHFSGLMERISKIVPFFDFWPFGYTESFELKEGKAQVPFFEKEFYKNYRSIGPFPDVPFSEKEMKARLTKIFFGPIQPMI